MVTTEQRIPMSWEEYLESDIRGEYIDGELVVSADPTKRHQKLVHRLADLLEAAVPETVEVIEGWGWKAGDDEFVPDIVVVDRTDEDARFAGIPHLVVEVLSSGPAADLVRKLGKYAGVGLSRYWVVAPDEPELVIYELAGDGFAERARYRGTDEVEIDFGVVVARFRLGDLIDRTPAG